MRVKLANKFLIIGLMLYIVAGLAFLSKMGYSIVILFGAIVFIALGFFMYIKRKWLKIFK